VQEKPEIVLTASLPKPTMHEGDDLLVDVITSNPTDHIVYAGSGYGAGVAIELLNDKGKNVGPHAMGRSSSDNAEEEPVAVLHNSRVGLRPNSKQEFTWHFRPEVGYLVPGIYKLRAHRLDIKSHTQVYSNTVVLTVIP